MIDKDTNSSVHDEQFDKVENTNEETKSTEPSAEHSEEVSDKPAEASPRQADEEIETTGETDDISAEQAEPEATEKVVEEEAKTITEETASEPISTESTVEQDVKAQDEENLPTEPQKPKNTEPVTSDESEEQPTAIATDIEKTEPVSEDKEPDTGTEQEDNTRIKNNEQDDESTEQKENSDSEEKTDNTYPELEEVDYAALSKEDLCDFLQKLLREQPLNRIKNHVETIKTEFYKQYNAEVDAKKEKFLDDGGIVEDFKIEESPLSAKMKELLNEYRLKRSIYNKNLEEEKEKNLKAKLDIIEHIKELINSQESLNKTFQDFRDLQDKWREVGPIPKANLKNLWQSYHYHVEAFYDYIKINKELRDLDFKKNLEAKLELCEKAEALIVEPSVVSAFKQLQTLHDQWREIGPVPSTKRSELWDRFKDATSKINHRHQEYFVKLKEEQKTNLQEKTALCEKTEQILTELPSSAKQWEEKSKELIELQKTWKTIGFAPKKYNTKIYERFRSSCDKFFNMKREFFSQNREEQENNLQLKTELCMQVEAMQDSTDWKKTTDEIIKLQKKWKNVGPVPIKQSDKIWKRFRAACDIFFNAKSEFYSNIDSTYEDNLKLKEALIDKIEALELGNDVNENLKNLKDIQREWSDIGFVPIKQKDSIQEKYRDAINAKFDALKLEDNKKSILKFRSRIEGIAEKPNAAKRLIIEREKAHNKLKQLESDLTTWENNIGFFANSKNADALIGDFKKKIENGKKQIEVLKQKVGIIDEYDF